MPLPPAILPLVDAPEPIDCRTLHQYCVVSIQDASQRLEPRRTWLAEGQDILYVPNLKAKLDVLLAGLGCGYLPECLVKPYIKAGKLVTKPLVNALPQGLFNLIWRTEDTGKALEWWIAQINRPDFMAKVSSAI